MALELVEQPAGEGNTSPEEEDLNQESSGNVSLEQEFDEEKMILEKARAAEAARLATANLCDQCGDGTRKYRCPKCDARTCSLECSKKHKADKECDGVRGAWQPVRVVSQLNEQRVNEDSAFLSAIQQGLITANQPQVAAGYAVPPSVMVGEVAPPPTCAPPPVGGLRFTANSGMEKYLMDAAHRRRVYLAFDDSKKEDDSTRHEQFSDTIFWDITLEFRKMTKMEGDVTGGESVYTYTVHKIPETIHVRTILRQFLKPRQHGPLVSTEDLDLVRLAPFIEAGADNINLFMRSNAVGCNKYRPVFAEKTLLDNLRNAKVINHPIIIVCLQNEFTDMELISREELVVHREQRREEIRCGAAYGRQRGNQRASYHPYPRNGGSHERRERRDANDWRERRGGRGGGFDRGGRRGGRGGGGGPRGGDRVARGGGWNRRQRDEFDPFEPFAGEYGREFEQAMNAWDNCVNKNEGSTIAHEKEVPTSGKKNYFVPLNELASDGSS